MSRQGPSTKEKAGKVALKKTLGAVGVLILIIIVGVIAGPLPGVLLGSFVLALSGYAAIRNEIFKNEGAGVTPSQKRDPLATTGVGGALIFGAAIASATGWPAWGLAEVLFAP